MSYKRNVIKSAIIYGFIGGAVIYEVSKRAIPIVAVAAIPVGLWLFWEPLKPFVFGLGLIYGAAIAIVLICIIIGFVTVRLGLFKRLTGKSYSDLRASGEDR